MPAVLTSYTKQYFFAYASQRLYQKTCVESIAPARHGPYSKTSARKTPPRNMELASLLTLKARRCNADLEGLGEVGDVSRGPVVSVVAAADTGGKGAMRMRA